MSREDHEMITTVPMHQLCRSAMRFARLSKLHVRNHFVTHITVFLWAGSRGRARVTPTSLPNSRSATQNPLTCRFIRSNVRWAQAIYAPSQQISKTSARQPIRPIAARHRFGTDNLGRSGVDMAMCCPATHQPDSRPIGAAITRAANVDTQPTSPPWATPTPGG